jgi:S-sulfo-L-cysteine synthase (O-acetyl-L-serine-dependent)
MDPEMSQLLTDRLRSGPTFQPASGDLTASIGNTPLVRLNHVTGDLPSGVSLHAKVEWFNPGGSIKDRAALRMITEGVRSGRLTPDRTLLDATSGNTGIGYALVGASLGYRVKLCIPRNVAPERRSILKAYGAQLVFTDPLEGSDGAIREARRLYESSPQSYFYPDQYSNPANWRAHYDTTGPEIWSQTGGQVTHFVAGLGTSGTFMGVGRRLRDYSPAVRLVAFQPDSPFHGLDGMKHMGSAIVPEIYDSRLADEHRTVSTEEAYLMMKRLSREEGLLAGASAAASVCVALKLARELTRGVVVTVLPDSASRYMSERFWQEMESDGERS